MLLKGIEAGVRAAGRDDVRLIDAWIGGVCGDKVVHEAVNWRPDVVVIQPHPVDPQDGLDLAAAVKRAVACTVVAVGPAVELHPGAMRPPESAVDLALPGESERAVLDVLDRLRGAEPGQRGVVLQKPVHPRQLSGEELEALPFPTYTLCESLAYASTSYPIRMAAPARWGFVLSGRGCPHGCLFCSPVTRKSSGRALRLRRAANVVDEIEHLIANGVNVVSFEDDDLTASRDHVAGICREMVRRRLAIRWICHARVDELDVELMGHMAGAGCALLRLGVESGSEQVLERLNKNPRRIPWRESCLAVFAHARRLGIATNALVILGNPDETRDEVNRTIDLVLDLDPDLVQAHFFMPYPGSTAADHFRHLVPSNQAARLHHYGLPVVNLSRMTLDELREARSRLYRRFFARPSFLARHAWLYWRFYLANPGVARHLLRGFARIQST